MGRLWVEEISPDYDNQSDPEPEYCRAHSVSDDSDDVCDCLQISKLLVVDPKARYTAKEALEHPFFKREEREREKREFFAKRLFKAAVITVIATNRIQNLHRNPPPISMDQVRKDPYSIKAFRKVIDAGAFRIYGHWVKKGENQNRAALFENVPKKDLKSSESLSIFHLFDFEVKGRVGRKAEGDLRIRIPDKIME